MSFTIEDNDSMPPVSGGYLILKLDGDEFRVVSVPSPILGADRHRDSVTENYDLIDDSEGNQYSINVWSSNVGVDWQIDVKATDPNMEGMLRDRIEVEYRANEF